MISLQEIIRVLKPVKVIGESNRLISEVITFNVSNRLKESISWINEKNIENLYGAEKGTIICPDIVDVTKLNEACTYLIFKSPRKAFRELLLNFFVPKLPVPIISTSAVIGNNVKIGLGVYIGNHTVIEDDVEIGDNTYIYHNNSILSKTVIQNNVKIGCNNTIGGIGFGYEKDESGAYQMMPHIGGVVIEENVEIGNNTCIDRAVLGNTLLKKNCKIDNLVHIAHGVVIGENSLIIAHAMIGGSTLVGDNVWIAPNAAIINKVTIGNNATVGLGAVVVKNVGPNEIVVGNPAKIMNR